jgi:hypothetical protein
MFRRVSGSISSLLAWPLADTNREAEHEQMAIRLRVVGLAGKNLNKALP